MMKYFDQAKLMLTILPIVGQEEVFAYSSGFCHIPRQPQSTDVRVTFSQFYGFQAIV